MRAMRYWSNINTGRGNTVLVSAQKKNTGNCGMLKCSQLNADQQQVTKSILSQGGHFQKGHFQKGHFQKGHFITEPSF